MSSTRYLALAFVLTVSITLNAANVADCSKCDCTHWPWKDTCERCCSLNVINNSSSGELHQFLKLGPDSLQKLYSLREKGPISSVDDLQKTIGPAQTDQIFQQIQALTPLEKQYLSSPSAQKDKLRDKMEAAGRGASPPS